MKSQSLISIAKLFIYFFCAFLISCSIGLNAVIIPLFMEENTAIFSSFSTTLILSSETAIAIIFCLSMAKIIRKWGLKKTLIFSIILRISSLLLMSKLTSVESWFILSITLGVGTFFGLMIIQLCINHIKITRFKGLIYSLFGTVISLGIATGPVIYSKSIWLIEQLKLDTFGFLYHEHSHAFIVSAMLTLFFILPFLTFYRIIPKIRKVPPFSLRKIVNENKGVLFAVALCGISFFGVSWYITIYGIRNELSLLDSSLLLTAFMLGSVCLDAPISALSEYIDRRFVLVYSALICTILAIFLPLAIYDKYQAYGLLFLWGGLISGMYSNCLFLLEKKMGSKNAIAGGTAFALMENTGATIGLVFIGFLVNIIGTDGFSYVIIFANLVYFSFVLINYKVDKKGMDSS